MRANSIARRYARATFEVAHEKGEPEGWLRQLEAVSSATSQPDLADALRSPAASDQMKVDAIVTVFPDLPGELRNLIALLVGRNRIDILPGICAAFQEYLDDLLGRVDAEVTSARPLSGDELRAIQDHLNKRTGRQVRVHISTDESLIGGIIMRVGDEVIDASVATKLDRLRQRLA